MRKTNTFKKIFIITALVLSLGLATFGVSRIKRADAALITDVSDASGEYVTYTYEIYDYDTYIKWLNWQTDLDNYLSYAVYTQGRGSNLRYYIDTTYGNEVWDGTDGGGDVINATNDSSKTAYDYYGGYPEELLGAVSVDDRTGEVTWAGPNKAKAANLEEIEQGQKIVVAVFATAKGGASLNGAGITMSSTLNGAATYENEFYDYDHTNDKPNWGSSYVGVGPYKTNDSFTGTNDVYGIKLGGQDTSSTNTGYGGTQYLGALVYTIDQSFNGALNLAPIGDSSTFFALKATGSSQVKYTAAVSGNHTHFVVDLPTYSIQGLDPTDVKLKSITINTGSNPYTVEATSTVPIPTSLTISDAAKQPAATKTNVTVSVTVNSTGETYTISSSDSASGPWTNSSGTVTLEPPGSSTFIKIYTTSSDNNHHETYIIEVPRKEYEDALMTSVGTITAVTTSSGVAPTLSPSFASSTNSYNISYASDSTSITLTPVFDDGSVASGGKGMTGYIIYPGSAAESPINSGDPLNISSIADNATFTIRIKAQNTTKYKDYSFTLKEKSSDNSLVVGVAVGSTAKPGAFGTTTATETEWTLNNPLLYGENYATVTLSNPKGATIVATLDGSTQSNPANINFGTTVTAVTKTLNVTVTSQAGSAKTYTVKLVRGEANTHKELDTTATKVYYNPTAGGAAVEVAGSWSGNVWTASADVPFTAGSFYVVPVLANDCLQDASQPFNATNNPFVATMKLNGSTSVASGANSSTTSFTGYAQDSKSVTIVVRAQSDVSGTNTNTYTFNIQRAAADTDSSLKAGVTPTVVTTDPDSSNVTLDAYNTSSKEWSNTAAIDAKYTKASISNLEANKSTSKIEVSTDSSSWTAYSGSFLLTLTRSNTPSYTTLYVRVTAENPSNKTIYTIKINSQALQTGLDFTATVTSTGDNQTVSQKSTSTPTIHYFDIAKNNGSATNTQFTIRLDLNSTTSDRAKLYWGTSATSQTTAVADGGTIPAQNIGAFGSPTLIYVKVVSEYGTPEVHTYSVQHTDTRDTNNKIADIQVITKDYKGNTYTNTYTFNQSDTSKKTLNLPYTVTSIQFVVRLEKTTSTLIYNSGTPKNPDTSGGDIVTITPPNIGGSIAGNVPTSQTFSFQGRSEATTTDPAGIYEIEVKRDTPETGQVITSLVVNSGSYTPTAGVDTPIGISSTSANVTVNVSPKADFTFEYGAVTEDTNPIMMNNQIPNSSYKHVKIKVYSEKVKVDGGSPTIYDVYLVNASQLTEIDDIELLEYKNSAASVNLPALDSTDFNYNSGVYDYAALGTVKIAYATGEPYFQVNVKSTNPNVWITGDTGLQTLPVGSKTFKITVNSEYNQILNGLGIALDASQTKEYKIKIQRVAASTEAELLWAKVDYVDGNGVAQTVTVNLTNPQNIENVGHISNAVLSFEKKDSKALLISPSPNTDDRLHAPGTVTIPLNFSTDGQKVAVQIICQAEDGINTKTYNTFWIASTQAVLDTDASLNKLRGYGDVTTADQIGYPVGAPTYNITIPGGNTKFYVDAIPTKAGASVWIDDGSGTLAEYTGSGAKEITLGAPGTTVNIRVQCHAQDPTAPLGTMYYINVTRDNLDQDATLKAFKAELYDASGTYIRTVQAIPGWSASDNGGNYTLNVTNDIGFVKLIPTLNSTKANITNNDADTMQGLVVGSNGPFIVTATAEDITKVNNFNVTVVKDDEVEALNIVITDTKGNVVTLTPAFTSNGSAFTGTVPYTEDKVTITVSPKGNPANLTITGDGQQPVSEGANSLVVTIKAASTASKSYTFNITRSAGASDNYLESYLDNAIEGTNKVPATYARLATTFEYNLPRNTTVWAPTFTLSTGATSNFDSLDKTLAPGKNVKVLTITSEKGAPRDVTIEIYCTQTEKELASLSLLETAGGVALADKNNGNVIQLTPTEVLSIDVPYGSSAIMSAYIKAVLKATSNLGAIYIDSAKADAQTVQVAQGANTYVVTVLSEDDLAHGKNQITAPEKQYTITVNRQAADSDAHLSALQVEVYKDGAWTVIPFETPVFTSADNGGSYVIVNLDTATYGSTTRYKVTAEAVKSTTKINSTSTGTFVEEGQFVSDVSTSQGFLKEINVVTLAEDGSSTYTFKITLSRGSLDLNGDNTLSSFSLVDSTGRSYISSSAPTQDSYGVFEIPYSANSLTFSVAKGSSWSPATVIYKKGTTVQKQSASDLVFSDTITASMRGTTVVYTVQAKAQNGNLGTAHTITVKFLEADKNAYLSTLMADSQVVTGFDPNDTFRDNYTYTLANRPFEKQNIVLSATGPSLATISGLGSRPLREGLNSFDVYVTSESGYTVTYTILVTREEQDPYLNNLQVSGKQLLDSSFAATTFNKAIKQYYAKVSYYDDEVTLVTNVDNATYTVTSSNGSVETVNGNSKTFKTSSLAVGYNYVTVTVSTQSGRYTDYNLVIYKQDQQSATATVTNIQVKGYGNSREEELPTGMFNYEDGKTVYDKIVVENRITEIHLNVTPEFPNETVQILNNTNLKVGENKVYAVVTAEDGVSKRVIEFNVTRKAPNYVVDIDKVSQFKPDYAAGNIKSQYEVESKDFEANIEVLADENTAQGFTYTPHKVALVPGENTFKLIITDPSGAQEETEVTIFRKHMSFGVNQMAYAYNCQPASQNKETDNEWYYTIDMNGDSVSKINNFAQYITNLSDGCNVQVLTNTSYDSVNEVLLRVSNIDETEVKYVHFKINNAPQSTNNSGTLNNIILWVMIGILALLLLLIIFILIYVRVILVVMNNRRRRDDED